MEESERLTKLALLRARRAWGLQGNLLPFSIAELDRQIAELASQVTDRTA